MKQKLTQEQQEYDQLVHRVTPRSEIPLALLKAFAVGGIICCIGQLVADFGKNMWGLEQKDASTLGSVFLVFLASLLTGLGVFDRLGKFAGAGTFVPITGFANSIVSPAMEYKREGYVLGVGAKMFTVAGPVLVYGITASVLYGVLYWLWTLIFATP